MAGKKLSDYENNLDDMPMDEESVEALIQQMDDEPEEPEAEAEVEAEAGEKKDEKGVTEDPDKTVDDEGKKPESEAKKAETEDDKKDDAKDEQPVIKTRDGKHEIPYSVLEAERERVRKLNRELEELKAESERIEEQRKQQATTQDDPGKSAEKDNFDLEAYREEFGDEAAEAEKARREQLHEMRETQKRLEKELNDNRTWREQQEAKAKETAQQEADRLQNEVNEAIDSIPELSKWMSEGDPMWDAAVALDNRLQKDPAFKDYSLKERFETVVERLTGKQPAPKQTEEDLDKAVDKKLADKEAASRTTPNSLSDLPGGTPADQSDSESVERMTPLQIEAKLAKMSADDVDAFLARL